PAAPTNLVTSTPAVGQVDLTWTDNSANETRFEIAQDDSLAVVRTLAANATSTSFTGLNAGTSYDRKGVVYGTGGGSDGCGPSGRVQRVVPADRADADRAAAGGADQSGDDDAGRGPGRPDVDRQFGERDAI